MEELKLISDYPQFIQTTAGFIFKVEGYDNGKLLIDQGYFISYYDIEEEAFFGVENGAPVKRTLKAKIPDFYKTWKSEKRN